MAWTTLTFAFGSLLTSAKMTSLQDNFTALATGLSGAPKIITAAFDANSINADRLVNNSVGVGQIGSNAVHTSELNEGTSNTSTTTEHLVFTMTGGLYVFSPQVRSSTGTKGAYCYGSGSTNGFNPGSVSTSFITIMGIGVQDSGLSTCYAQWYYVAASPPHDMGDGDIPAFIFAVIDNTSGDIESISYGTDPVWQANGPTDAMPTIRDEDGLFKVVKEIPASFESLSHHERVAAIRELPDVRVPITEELKHADMDIIPHPFQGNDLTGKTVVMLDPVSQCVRDLHELCCAGEDIHDIIRGGYINIGNSPLERVTPAGLLIPATSWNKTL